MESLPESQSRLLSLPLELRLQICKQFLKGWRISLMYWGRSFGSVDSTTKSDIFDDEMWKISLFHINRQTRLLATSLIGPCVSMGLEARYLRPTRSNYGKPIPQLFLEKIQTLRFDYFNEIATSEIALESFPALRYLILDCGAWPVEIFGSHVRKDWSAYASDGKDGELLEFGYRSVVSGDWTRGLFQDKTRTWHMICDTGIDFPDIKGECVETMNMRFECDLDTNTMLSKTLKGSEEPYSGHHGYWDRPIGDLWQVGSNAKLEEAFVEGQDDDLW